MRTLQLSPIIRRLLSYLLIIAPFYSDGQFSEKVKLSNVGLVYKEDKVTIPYTLNGKAGEDFVVWVELFNSKNTKIDAKSISGDINLVKGSGSKQILWDIKKDAVILDDNIYAKVSAKLVTATNTSKAFLKSTIYPGWGDYQYKADKPHWVKGVLGYSLIGASVFMNYKAVQNLDDYRKSGLPSTQDPSFSDAKQSRNLSFVFAGAAIAVWVWDYFDIFSKAKKNITKSFETIMLDDGYKLYAEISPKIRINTRGLPPNLFADLSFSDENGNGLLEAREKAMLNITLSNQGKGDALQLEVNVSDSINDPGMAISNANQKINMLKSGESIKVSIPISTDVKLKTATHKLTINVLEHYGYDMDPAFLVLDANAYQSSQLVFSGYEIIDSGAGTGAITEDGKLQAGEQVKAKLTIQNIGQDIAMNSSYSIRTTDPNIYIDNAEGALGDIKPGEIKDLFVTLSPNKRVTTKDNLPIYLTLKEDIGNGNLDNFQLPIALNQRPPQTKIVTVKAETEPVKKKVARFEYKSNKFRTNIVNVVNISSIVPSTIKRPNSVGVVFGVSSYKELPQAPYADNDAKIIKDYFEKVLGVEQVILYTNDQVNGFIFDDVFNPDNGELQRAIVKGETEVFVFYSGHGIPDKTGENIYLFPSDGKISRLETQGYNIEKLYQNLSRLGAKHVTVILDACFSGGSRKTEKIQTENLIAQKGVKIRPKNSWLIDPNFTIITSSTGEETSLGFDISETGLFTYYLCAGLQGKADANADKVITLGELKNYVIQNVTETSRKISGLQTPIFTGDDNIVLTSYK